MNENLTGGISADLSGLSEAEKKAELFEHQKHTLDLFLERGAISKAQYDKSLGTLKEKLDIKQDNRQPLIRKDSI